MSAQLQGVQPNRADDRGARESGLGRTLVDILARFAPLFILAALLVAGTLVNPNFWALNNIRNMLTQNASVSLVAFGMTLVIISGVFDLSVGAIFAAGSVSFAMLSNQMPMAPAAALSVLVGVAAGAINGYVVNALKVNSFIGTIATGAVFSGLVYIACNSSPVQAKSEGYDTLGLGRIWEMPWAVVCVVVAYLICAGLLNKTIFGRYVFASGGNAEAALLNGIPVHTVRMWCFIVVGALAAFGGIVTGSQLGLGQPTLGANIALDAFAIVVIGGTSVYGGRGAIWRTLTGVLILATLTNIFNAMAWDTTRQSVAKGLIVIAAVALDAVRRSRR
ncbi:MAG: transporter permease [Cryobacterium sp.]|nr:transporter permease [Cryobacterium sp.]